MREVCDVEGCFELPKYHIYMMEPDGNKTWLHVCKKHEQRIGNSNMRLQGYDTRGRKLKRG